MCTSCIHAKQTAHHIHQAPPNMISQDNKLITVQAPDELDWLTLASPIDNERQLHIGEYIHMDFGFPRGESLKEHTGQDNQQRRWLQMLSIDNRAQNSPYSGDVSQDQATTTTIRCTLPGNTRTKRRPTSSAHRPWRWTLWIFCIQRDHRTSQIHTWTNSAKCSLPKCTCWKA